MALILIVGHDTALLEGVCQTLVAAGHHPVFGEDMAEGVRRLAGARPLVAVVETSELLASGGFNSISLARGGALVTFHGDESDPTALPHRVERTTLAKLQLPLERQRLLALIRYVQDRARASGRDRDGGGAEEQQDTV